MATKEITVFSFSVPRTRKAEQELSDLISKINQSKIDISFMTGFGVGRRFKIFCIPVDATAFGEFLKSVGRRYVRELKGYLESKNNLGQVLGIIEKHMLSGTEIRGFDILKFSSGASLYYVKNEPV